MCDLPPNMTLKRAMYLLQDGRCPYCGRVMMYTTAHIADVSSKRKRSRVATEEHPFPS